jgi:Ni,Fe-hydrogenase maturation factor
MYMGDSDYSPYTFKLDRPGSLLISHFQSAEQVVIIDAVRLFDHPGRVTTIDLEQLH